MKIKLYKFLGVALTVTLLVSLMIGLVAAPAAADTLKWSTMSFPKTGADGNWFMDSTIDSLGPMSRAIDGTIYLAAEVDGEYSIFKSTDGRKWSETEYNKTTTDIVDYTIYAIACSSLDADIVYVANEDGEVYKTSNAGKKWAALAAPTLNGGRITGLDIGYIDEKPYDFISVAGGSTPGVFVLQEAVFAGAWDDLALDEDTLVVRVSPNFEDDQFIAAVYTTGSETWVTTKYSGSDWGTTVPEVELEPDGTAVTHIAAPYFATIFLPGNFDSDEDSGNMEYFVGIASTTEGEGDVYRIVTDNAFDRDIAGSDTGFNVTGLGGVGDAGDCYLLAAGNDGSAADKDTPNVYYSSDNGSSWTETKEAPAGADYYLGQAQVSVLVADDYADSGEAFMATVGDNTAVSFTNDFGKSCNQVSMISASATTVDSLAFGSRFLVVSPGSQLYRYDDTNWERTYLNANMTQVQTSPNGDAVFIIENTGKIRRSTDDGTRFSAQLSTPPAGFSGGWMVIDKNTVIVGGGGEVFKTTNNGTTWKTYDNGLGGSAGDVLAIVLSPDFDADETIIAATDLGYVYRSTDGGESWKKLTTGGFDSDSGATYAIFSADYADNGVMFAAGIDSSDNLVVQRYGVDGEGWEDITPNDDNGDWSTVPDTGGATGLVVGPEGTLYVSDYTAQGVFRSLNPTTSDTAKVAWENVTDKFTGTDANNIAQLQLTLGSNILWGIEGDDGYDHGNKIWMYEDTLTGKPTLSAPTDGSSTGRVDRADVAWSAMDGAKVYDIWVDTDPGFKSGSKKTLSSEVTSKVVTGLEDGQTYYWKVRVAAGEPVQSNWSVTWSFTTKLGAGEWNPFVGGVPEAPSNGATNVPLQPTFAWNSADWATGYEFVLAKDAAFSDTVASKTGANALSGTVYLCEQKLANSTTYYWRVRAISKTSNSEWASAVFTTEGTAPAAPKPPSAPPPPPPAPGTPAYIWVIIGIGAPLVIAVIVLIVRTRRVA